MRFKFALIITICVTAVTVVQSSKTDELGEGLAALGIKPDQILAEAKGCFFCSKWASKVGQRLFLLNIA
jgi:hypothetical protein